MPCVSPLVVYPGGVKSLRGWLLEKRSLDAVTDQITGEIITPKIVGCGSCDHCRKVYKAQWAVRNVLESKSHPSDSNFFVTLTYDDDHIPLTEDGIPTLRFADFSGFVKRLRNETPVRFFACSEYGSKSMRPHYHALLYGINLDDIRYAGVMGADKHPYYESDKLKSKWSYGNISINEFSAADAAYVAGYTAKKLYTNWDDTIQIERPALRMSRRPGIGGDFIEKYKTRLLRGDQIYVSDGRTIGLPSYYLDKARHGSFEDIKALSDRARKLEFKSAFGSDFSDEYLKYLDYLLTK